MIVRFNKTTAILFILGGIFLLTLNVIDLSRGQFNFFDFWGIFISLVIIIFSIPPLYVPYLTFETNKIVFYFSFNHRKTYHFESVKNLRVEKDVLYIQTQQGVETINNSRFFVNQKDWKRLLGIISNHGENDSRIV